MRKIVIGCVLLGVCGLSNSMPASELSTPLSTTVTPTTEKAVNAHSAITAENKGGKEAHIVQTTTTPSSSVKPSEHVEVTTKSANTLDVTVPSSHKNKPTSSNLLQEEKKEFISPNKDVKNPIAVSPPAHITKSKDVTSVPAPNHKAEAKEPTTGHEINPMHKDGEKKDNSANNKKPEKKLTTYVNEGKVVIFNGICGPEGCEIEGDIYDELAPITHTKKHG